MIKLGVNIDHVATVRQARREDVPSVVSMALLAVQSGADGITAHLREDRRHIQDADIFNLKEKLPVALNMEMAASQSVLDVALQAQPAWACLVPEKRQELTTEGGLDVQGQEALLRPTILALKKANIRVSLFVDPNPELMPLCFDLGANAIELHTGVYAHVFREAARTGSRVSLDQEMNRIGASAQAAQKVGLVVNAGHGLNQDNVSMLVRLFPFNEFNIGFSLVAQALEVGLGTAVQQMKKKMRA